MVIEQFDLQTISDKDLTTINPQRAITFKDDFSGNLQRSNNHRLFVILREDNEIKAFGILLLVEFTVGNKVFGGFGSGNIVATQKGYGYGKKLLVAIRDILIEQNKVGVGFCYDDVAEFYIKCGYKIGLRASNKFIYTGEPAELQSIRNILYFSSNFDFTTAIEHPDTIIYINQPFW